MKLSGFVLVWYICPGLNRADSNDDNVYEK